MPSDITNIINIFSKFLDPKVTKADKFKSIEEIKKPLPYRRYFSCKYISCLKSLQYAL